MVKDVSEQDFMQSVIERSHEVPVVVDFWAEWCGPCRQLGPVLEKETNARNGDVELAKLDVDANQRLAAEFRVQGIPAVKAFRDGKVVSEFTGAIPPSQVERFFDALVPSEAEKLASSTDEEALRRALELDPKQVDAARTLGKLLVARGDNDEAAEILAPFEADFVSDGLRARLELAATRDDLEDAWKAWDAGKREDALDELQAALVVEDGDDRDRLRRVMVAILTELGQDHPLAREHRRRMAAALN